MYLTQMKGDFLDQIYVAQSVVHWPYFAETEVNIWVLQNGVSLAS